MHSMEPAEPKPWRAPYGPALARTTRALAAAALVVEAVELGLGPHREISAIFLGVGLLVGYAVGRSLARELREWAKDAPALDAAEATRVCDTGPSPWTVAALLVVIAIALVVPIEWQLPTPLPGAMAAAAIQALMQARGLRAIENERVGEILRPVGQLSFEGSELRLRMKPSSYADPPAGAPIMPG
jgi:hypothetical protein